MIDPFHGLLDDRPLIQIGGHEMCRRADQFHASLMGAVIGAGTLETRQEAVVDIDASPFQPPDQIF